MREIFAAAIFIVMVASGVALGQAVIGGQSTTTKYTFLQIPADNRYFIGRLPRLGEPVEIVYLNKDAETNMLNFQLRVRQ